MIQRIQTIYLLLAACCMALCFMFPTATYQANVESLGVQASGELNLVAHAQGNIQDQLLSGQNFTFGQEMFVKTWPMMVLSIVIIVLALVAMFLYTNRKIQVRVTSVGFLLSVVYVFLVFIWMVDAWSGAASQALGVTNAKISYGVGTWTPIVAVVLFILAQRAIKKDEEKVRAADRLR